VEEAEELEPLVIIVRAEIKQAREEQVQQIQLQDHL
jgi:hypothetical protein